MYAASDYIMSLKNPAQVRDVAAALSSLDAAEFRRRYFAINSRTYEVDLSEEDLDYTWDWFQEVRELYVRAAAAGRWMLFTADQ